jgi:ubiquinone biosynthesis protein
MSQRSFTSRIRNARRMVQVIQVFARHGFWSLMARTPLRGQLSKAEQKAIEFSAETEGAGQTQDQSTASRLRMAFEELGPAYVKLGQILATRSDLVPISIVEELSKLHSNVQAMPFVEVIRVLEEELGKDALQKFAFIDEKPLAAGSIGQVHLARTHSGNQIVLKVQRPGITRLIRSDLDLMAQIAFELENYAPELKPFRPVTLVAELESALLGELDFMREAANTDKMSKHFANDEGIVIAEVYWEYTTSRVLALEYLDGERIPSTPHPDAAIIMRRGLEMFLKMVAIYGEYHGDLHPGNLLILPGARLGVLDFGLTVRLSTYQRLLVTDIFVGLVQGDCDRVARAMFELGEPSSDFDFESYNADLLNTIGPYMGGRLANVKTAKILMDFSKISAKHGLPVPRPLFLILKTLISFESVGKRLDPNFDPMALCAENADILKAEFDQAAEVQNQLKNVSRDLASLARIAPFQVRKLLRAATDGQLKFSVTNESTQELSRQVARAASRMAVSVILAGTILASSLLVSLSANWQHIGVAGYMFSGVLGLYIVFSILSKGGPG